MEKTRTFEEGVEFKASIPEEYAEILTPEAVSFVAKLNREFGGRVEEILEKRKEFQQRIDAGENPDFLSETQDIREGDWRVAPVPDDLQDRRVEIAGPPDRKMLINALNSGASTYMTDFEDANCPTWHNMLESQLNLRDAVRRTISFDDPETGKHYEVGEDPAVLIARPRGWHLPEKHMLVDGKQVRGDLFDFGLYFFHNAQNLIDQGSGPYFYLPKMEHHPEARLWNDVFNFAQDELGIPRGSIKATALLETFPAVFEMDEILYELKDHSAGLNAGRWDYIFSYIKTFRNREGFVLPDRSKVTMTVPFMRAYAQLLIKTCHRRGAHAGTWVAHPALVPVAKEVFDEIMPQPNQLDKLREDVDVSAADLYEPYKDDPITEAGLRNNVSVGIQYLGAWLAGRGAVPVFNLMEDAATAEISRTQVWQWIHHDEGILDDGTEVTENLFRKFLSEELEKIPEFVDPVRTKYDRFEEAAKLFDRISTDDDFVEFLTLPGYEYLE